MLEAMILQSVKLHTAKLKSDFWQRYLNFSLHHVQNNSGVHTGSSPQVKCEHNMKMTIPSSVQFQSSMVLKTKNDLTFIIFI
jgi:hypothetical protein